MFKWKRNKYLDNFEFDGEKVSNEVIDNKTRESERRKYEMKKDLKGLKRGRMI